MTHGANTPPAFEPARLADGNADDPVLDELGRWFAHAAAPSGIDAVGLARVARRLEGTEGPRRVLWRSVALSVALVIGAGGAAAAWGRYRAATHVVSPFARHTMAKPPAASPKPGGSTALHPAPELPVAPPDDAPPDDAPGASVTAPNGAANAPSTNATSARLAPRGAAPEPSADGELARESAALEPALAALRRDHDAAGALGLLERYAADFPAGVLRLEADVARVDANLALGNNAAALALLGHLPLERVGRGVELRLVRAELTAARDCKRANLDFDRVLATRPGAAFDERALFGRASCREKLGDTAGSRADWTTYLARYPEGRFAAAVRAALR